MQPHRFPILPNQSMLQFEGATCCSSTAWQAYLDSTLERQYPAYFARCAAGQVNPDLWRQNACILEAFEQYLFHQFGVLIPQDNLFKVYNETGDGVLPGQIVESISAVIEPLGYELDGVLVTDPELRQGLNAPNKTVDLSSADHFQGRAGVCMINIRSAYSHAFFWDCMDKDKFLLEQFRMAMLVKTKENFPITAPVTAPDLGRIQRLRRESAYIA